MCNFLKNTVANVAAFSLLTVLVWNIGSGVAIAHGPSVPPDPWEGIRIAA